jgi:hypothetical protein
MDSQLGTLRLRSDLPQKNGIDPPDGLVLFHYSDRILVLTRTD